MTADLSGPDEERSALRAESPGSAFEHRSASGARSRLVPGVDLGIEDFRQLHATAASLTGALDVAAVLEDVLDGALALQRTDLGTLALGDARGAGLELRAHRGFDPWYVEEHRWIPPGGGAAGTAYRERRRVVIEDVEADPSSAPHRNSARRAGFRGCHSTPLITRPGHIIGVLSAHFREPHRPSAREEQLIDLDVQMAAELLENAMLHSRLRVELDSRERLLRKGGAGAGRRRARQPDEGRVPRHGIPRAAHAAQRHHRVGAHPRRRADRSRRCGAALSPPSSAARVPRRGWSTTSSTCRGW